MFQWCVVVVEEIDSLSYVVVLLSVIMSVLLDVTMQANVILTVRTVIQN